MSSVAESVRPHSRNLQQQPCLDFDAVHEVPESHAWPQVEDYPGGYGVEEEEEEKEDQSSPIPVIDLAEANAAARMREACETWGVFQVTNHGIPMRLFDDVETQARRLFALPAQQKLKAARSPDGLTGYGIARIATFFSKLLWSEGFTIAGSPAEHARLLWSHPQDYSQFCEAMEEYDREMKKLARRLMWLMLASLGITKEDVTWAGPGGEMDGASAMFQLNWYPACPNPERAMGLAEHTDSPLFAILHQNTTTGLQVLQDGGAPAAGGTNSNSNSNSRWVTVPPLPGALVVNVGDLLHIFTNGRFKSVMHRAVVNRTRPRLSVAYFWGPPGNVWLSPLEKLVGPENGPLYPSMSWPEYLKIKGQHFNQSLSLIRLRPAVLHQPTVIEDTAAAAAAATATEDRNNNNSSSSSSSSSNNKTGIKAF